MNTQLPTCFTLLLIIVFLPALLLATPSPFDVSVIKVNKSYYTSDKAFYTARCKVQNNTTQAGQFYVQLLGLDEHGVTLHSIRLSGTIKENGTKVLRNKNHMDAKTYRKIKKWILNKADFI